MYKIQGAALALLLLACAPAGAASVTVAGLADSEDGQSYDLSASFSPVDSWSIGAGVGRSETRTSGADFSGTSLRLSTDLMLRSVVAGLSVQRWKDAEQVASTTILGQLGWLGESGWSVTALLDDRSMTVDYTATILGQIRQAQIDFAGTGIGADISWFGANWNLGVRFIDYRYGQSVDRVRAAISDPDTDRFPRMQFLLESVMTRAASAPDRQYSVTLGRKLSRSSLQGEWHMQRDALTGTKVGSLSLMLGYEVSDRLLLDTTAGFSDSGAAGTAAFGGIALTLRN